MENPIQETTDLFRFQITEEQEEERVDKCIAAADRLFISFFIQKMIKGGARLHQRLACQSKLSPSGRGMTYLSCCPKLRAGYRAGRHPVGHSL